MKRKPHPILGKTLFSLLIMTCYLFGKKVTIPWVVRESHVQTAHGIQNFISAAMGNDTEAGSILAVGFMPYMTAMIVVSLFHSVTGQSEQTSQKRIMRQMRVVTLIVAVLQSMMRASQMAYTEYYGCPVSLLKGMTAIVLTAGTFVMVWMSERCQKWGIGGSSALILANIVQNIGRSLLESLSGFIEAGYPVIPVILIMGCAIVLVAFVTLVMERAEMHLTIRHVMIHNSFSGDSDLAVKLNPVGTMAVMYVMTLFALPYYLCLFFEFIFGANQVTELLKQNLNLQSGWGILFFALILTAMNCALARIYINPREVAENLQKSGDYIPGVHPGEATRRVISERLWFVSLVSSSVMCVLMVGPLLLQRHLGLNSPVFMLPMTVMILCGIMLNVMSEVHTIRVMNTYQTIQWRL